MNYEISFKHNDKIYWNANGCSFSFLFDAFKNTPNVTIENDNTITIPIENLKIIAEIHNRLLMKNENYVLTEHLAYLGDEYANEYYHSLSIKEQSLIRVQFCFPHNDYPEYSEICKGTLKAFENGHQSILSSLRSGYDKMIEDNIPTITIQKSYS